MAAAINEVMAAHGLLDEMNGASKGDAASDDVRTLVRRCGVEMNEAIFLLEAASGDVRAAAKLASSTSSWAAPASAGSFGSLTAATNLALANVCKTSPPEDAPGSPLGGPRKHWPSISQAAASETDDWDLIETGEQDVAGEGAQPDDWVELDIEGEEAEKPASFKDKIMMPARAPAKNAEVQPEPQPQPKMTEKAASASACDMFSFDEAELHDELIHGDKTWKKSECKGKRDGHSKNSKKGVRQLKKDRKSNSRRG